MFTNEFKKYIEFLKHTDIFLLNGHYHLIVEEQGFKVLIDLEQNKD